MLKGKNILCFGSENWEYPGFQQSLMRKLSSTNNIIFINPLGSRKIKLQLSLFKIYLNRIKNNFQTKIDLSPNCLVRSIWIIPVVYSKSIMYLNKRIIKNSVDKLLLRKNFETYILWVGTPIVAPIIDEFKPELIIYHAVDRFSEFSFVDKFKIKEYELLISKKADAIICTSDAIRDDLKVYNSSTYTVTHAVDFEHFNLLPDLKPIPSDIFNIEKPIIGYFGGLSERINYSLLKNIALRYTSANLVLIGEKLPGLKELDEILRFPNVHFLGYKSYDLLPLYLKQFNVCLIPYHVNELMMGVDPIKLREYLCQAKPVVSTKLPEVEKMQDLIYVAENENDFVDKVGHALVENQNSIFDARIRLAKQCNWKNKISEIENIISLQYR